MEAEMAAYYRAAVQNPGYAGKAGYANSFTAASGNPEIAGKARYVNPFAQASGSGSGRDLDLEAAIAEEYAFERGLFGAPSLSVDPTGCEY